MLRFPWLGIIWYFWCIIYIGRLHPGHDASVPRHQSCWATWSSSPQWATWRINESLYQCKVIGPITDSQRLSTSNIASIHLHPKSCSIDIPKDAIPWCSWVAIGWVPASEWWCTGITSLPALWLFSYRIGVGEVRSVIWSEIRDPCPLLLSELSPRTVSLAVSCLHGQWYHYNQPINNLRPLPSLPCHCLDTLYPCYPTHNFIWWYILEVGSKVVYV